MFLGRRLLLVVVLGFPLAVVAADLEPGAAAAAAPALTSFTVSGSPFAQSFAPLPPEASLNAVLSRRARVTVSIVRPDGTLVRRICRNVRKNAGARFWSWNGLDKTGTMAPDGQYVARISAASSTGIERMDRPVRKGLPQIYPAAPGVIVVAVDPGHGGRFPGAVRDGYLEKESNLAIGLKLQALLAHAGVQVVMSRDTDVAVNDPPSDENGDGVLDRYDDDLERNDSANEARADVNIHIHNNASTGTSAHGTEAFTSSSRSWSALGMELAGYVLQEEVNALESYRSPDFYPTDHGVHAGWYYYVGPYDPPFLPRPALPVSVLSESLYVSNGQDLATLRRPDVQLSLAAAVYIALARYLNSRDYGLGYELLSGPVSAAAGSAMSYTLRVANRGNVPSSGWTLTLGAVPTVARYDGSGSYGSPLGAAPIPDGLVPGQSVDVSVEATAPSDAGAWLVKSDVVLPTGAHLSDAGIVPLQVALQTTIAP